MQKKIVQFFGSPCTYSTCLGACLDTKVFNSSKSSTYVANGQKFTNDVVKSGFLGQDTFCVSLYNALFSGRAANMNNFLVVYSHWASKTIIT